MEQEVTMERKTLEAIQDEVAQTYAAGGLNRPYMNFDEVAYYNDELNELCQVKLEALELFHEQEVKALKEEKNIQALVHETHQLGGETIQLKERIQELEAELSLYKQSSELVTDEEIRQGIDIILESFRVDLESEVNEWVDYSERHMDEDYIKLRNDLIASLRSRLSVREESKWVSVKTPPVELSYPLNEIIKYWVTDGVHVSEQPFVKGEFQWNGFNPITHYMVKTWKPSPPLNSK